MNYELIIQLKEAGFPIRDIGFDEGEESEFEEPTLSELIDALGKENYFELKYIPDESQFSIYWKKSKSIGKVERNGSTPEEVVALLYLSIKKHETN